MDLGAARELKAQLRGEPRLQDARGLALALVEERQSEWDQNPHPQRVIRPLTCRGQSLSPAPVTRAACNRA